MDDPRATRLVEAALRCYLARWRRRRADEAAELAALLIRDGASPRAIAWSYLAGAAREWLTPRPGRRLSAVACALLVPAKAVTTNQPRGHAHCAPATSHPRVTTREPGHDRSC